MAQLTFSATAKEQVRKLPRDATLLRTIWQRLEQAANSPDDFTEPAPFPHRPGRWLCTFRADDSSGTEYAFAVLFARLEDEMRVTQIAFHTTDDYPALDE